MCSRYRLISAAAAVRCLLRTINDEDFPPRHQIAPTQPVHVARIDAGGHRRLDLVRWGLIPQWTKDVRTLPPLFAVRAETALDKPTYRAGMRYRRCLVPSDGYYDWSGPKNDRQMHLVEPMRPGPIAFAGIWESWLGADGSEIDSMAILTVPGGPDAAVPQGRMPVIVPPERFDDWIDCRACPANDAAMFLKPAPAGSLRSRPIPRQPGRRACGGMGASGPRPATPKAQPD